MAYPIHETGDPAPWLREAMGDVNPRLAELAPHVVLEAVLYQLRAFRNAGFAAAVVLSGHHGGNQEDLRRVARIFCEAYPFEVFACSDPELVEGRYQGDHPGYYEISQLLAIDPSLVDLSRQRGAHADPLGRFAQNPDAGDDDAADGRKMLEAEFESSRSRRRPLCADRPRVAADQHGGDGAALGQHQRRARELAHAQSLNPGGPSEMDTSIFPRTDRVVGRLGFGAMGFAGWFGEQSEAEHIKALHYALDHGVNFIDTARAYGESEPILGRGLKQWRGEKPFVATKVEGLAGGPQWSTPVPVASSLPKGQVLASCEASLRALQLDSVDLLQLHAYWPVWGVEGHWMDELRLLKEQGKVRAVGISVPDHRSDMVLPIVMSGAIDSVQTIVNIFDPLALENLVPICQQHKVAVIARCILDEGGLTGMLTPDIQFPPGDFRAGYFEGTTPRATYIEKVEALKAFLPAHASSLAALALKFALWHPGVTTAITSMHEQRYARMNIAAAAEPRLSTAVFKTLMFKHRFIKSFMDVRNFVDIDAIPDPPLSVP